MPDLPPDLPEHVRAFLAVAGSPPRPWSTLTAQQAVDELSGGRPLGIVGSSAGGNLAIAATLVDRDRGAGRIALHVPMCPVTDHAFDTPSYIQGPAGGFLEAADMRWYWAQYLADPADGDNPLASVLRADLHGMPPALVVTAGLDVLRDEGEAYAHALAAAGSEVSLARFEHMVHAFPTLSAFSVEQGEVIELIGDAVEVLR